MASVSSNSTSDVPLNVVCEMAKQYDRMRAHAPTSHKAYVMDVTDELEDSMFMHILYNDDITDLVLQVQDELGFVIDEMKIADLNWRITVVKPRP